MDSREWRGRADFETRPEDSNFRSFGCVELRRPVQMGGYHVRRDGACDRAAKRQTSHVVCLFVGETAASPGNPDARLVAERGEIPGNYAASGAGPHDSKSWRPQSSPTVPEAITDCLAHRPVHLRARRRLHAPRLGQSRRRSAVGQDLTPPGDVYLARNGGRREVLSAGSDFRRCWPLPTARQPRSVPRHSWQRGAGAGPAGGGGSSREAPAQTRICIGHARGQPRSSLARRGSEVPLHSRT